MTQVSEYLMKLGLTSSQAKALDVLFQGESMTAREIAHESGISYTKIYDALSSLEMLGAVKFTMDTPKIYHALKPRNVFDILLKQQEQSFQKLADVKEQVLEDVEVQWKDVEEHESKSNVWLFRNTDSIMEEVRTMIAQAEKSLQGCALLDTINAVWSWPGAVDALWDFKKKGAYAEAVHPTSLLEPRSLLALSRKLSPRNALRFFKLLHTGVYQIRLLPDEQIYQDFLILDKKHTGIGFIGEGITQWGIRFDDKKIAKFMLDYHKMLWEKAEPVDRNVFKKYTFGGKKK